MALTNRTLILLKYFWETTDEAHPISLTDISAHLKEHGITADPRTLRSDIEQLVEFGVDIVKERRVQNLYHVATRHFEAPEVKLLIDAVQSARFITPGKSKELVKRLTTFVAPGDAALLESFCHKIPVQPGESYMIPGGVPHALGAGCFVAEIQEPSDLTAVPFPQEYLLEYRRKANPFGIFEPEDEQLYESRMLNSFHYEGLPLDKLLDRLKSKEPVLRQEPGGREIEIFGDRDTSYFSCTMVTVSGAMARKNTGDVQIGIVVSGEGCIRCGENALPVKQGSEVFFPCQVRDAVFEGDFSIILCNPGVTAEYK